MQFETVTKKIDLADGALAAFDVCETWVALAEVEGEVYAVADLCTHAGCSLAIATRAGKPPPSPPA